MDNTPTTPAYDAPKTIKVGRLTFTFNVLLQALLFIVIVIAINYISRDQFVRADWSRDRNFTLSSQTKALLENLEKPVQVIVCAGAGGRQTLDVEQDAQELLREYGHASKGKVTVEMVDLGANLNRGRELQEKYKFGATESVIILDYDGRNKFVYTGELAEYEQMDQMEMMMARRMPQMIAFKGEQVITSALLELTEGKQNTVYLVTKHGEYDLNHPEFQVFREELKRQNVKLEALDLSTSQSVPEGAQAVAIVGPKVDLSERDLKLLTDYWDKKGRIFVAVSPNGGRTPNLDNWLGARGARPQQDLIINVQNLGGLAARVPLVAELTAGSPLTKEIENVGLQIFGYAQSLALDRTKETTEQLRITEFMRADKTFWGEKDYLGGSRDIPTFDPKRDNQGPLTIGATVEKGASKDPLVKLETPRLVVIGTGDFLSDRGMQMAQGVGGPLAVNAFNWLLSRENLIAIPPKAKKRSGYSVTEEQLAKVAQWVCLFIPLIVALFGLYHLWWRHGKNMLSLTFWLAVAFLLVVGLWYLLLWYLGVESAKSFPRGLIIAVSTAAAIGVAAFLMNTAERKKAAARA